MGLQTQADAQFLKKLGSAIDKGMKKLDQVTSVLESATGKNNGSTNSPDNEERMIGKPIKIGPSTLIKYGNNPGMNINWQGLYRIYGSTVVTSYFQFINEAELKLTVDFGFFSSDNYALDNQGRKFRDESLAAGNRIAGPTSIEPDARSLYTVNYQDVPASVKEMQMVLIKLASNVGQNSGVCRYSFRVNDVPIRILPAMTAKGIIGEQKLLIGSAIEDLPQAFPFLYDAYTVTTEEDEGETMTIVHFTKNGQETMTAISNDQKTIANIDVFTSDVYVKVGEYFYSCGSKMARMTMERGITKDEYGNVSYQGVYFDKDSDGMVCGIHI